MRTLRCWSPVSIVARWVQFSSVNISKNRLDCHIRQKGRFLTAISLFPRHWRMDTLYVDSSFDTWITYYDGLLPVHYQIYCRKFCFILNPTVYSVSKVGQILAFSGRSHSETIKWVSAVPLSVGGWIPSVNVGWAEAYFRTKWHLDPSNRLVTTHQRCRQTGQRLRSIGPTTRYL